MTNGNGSDDVGRSRDVDEVSEGAADAAEGAGDIAERASDAVGGITGDGEGASDAVSGAAGAIGDVASSVTDSEEAERAGEIADTVMGAVETASNVVGSALSRDGRDVGDATSGVGDAASGVSGLVSDDEGVTIIERVGQVVDTVGAVASAAGRVVDVIQGLTRNVELHFECDAVTVSWHVESATLEEQISRPYKARVMLMTRETDANPAELLGQACKLTIDRRQIIRTIPAIVSEVNESHTGRRRLRAEICIVPAVDLLRHRVNTKIFQDKTVPQILKQVLDESIGTYQREVELRLDRQYPTCEYKTQFDESDLDFCHRLMEEEGIMYWFEFEDDVEKIVLADASSRHPEIEAAEGCTLEFTTYEGNVGGHEYVGRFNLISQIRPTRVALRHHNWTATSFPIEGDSGDSDSSGAEGEDDAVDGARIGQEREQYEHETQPLTLHEYSESYQSNDVEDQVRLRREQQAFDARMVDGESTAIGMTAGAIFELNGHPRSELDVRYLLHSVTHTFGENEAENRFRCIPASVPYRSRRTTRRPRISGMQSAVVVGPSGEEIHTDPHGRVKLQFHWDREGQRDEHSSCWVRVVQPWAGARWGFVFLPRIGMEVVVTFLDGDPDRPIVTGSVYNNENAPPYDLPDNKTRATIKSQSSLGGEGYNELTFEDLAGEEQIITHAQKDYNETVENNHNTTVHGGHTNTVDGDDTESVGGDQELSVAKSRNVTVDENATLTVGGTRDVGVDGEMKVLVHSSSFHQARTKYVLDVEEDSIKMTAPKKIILECGGTSTIRMTPNDIEFIAGNGARLKLDANADMIASGNGRVLLTENAVMRSNAGSHTRLTSTAEMRSPEMSKVHLSSNANVIANAGAQLELTGDAVMTSSKGASEVNLGETSAEMKNMAGGQVTLDTDATLSGAVVKLNP